MKVYKIKLVLDDNGTKSEYLTETRCANNDEFENRMEFWRAACIPRSMTWSLIEEVEDAN